MEYEKLHRAQRLNNVQPCGSNRRQKAAHQPISSEKPKAVAMMDGERAKEKANSEKDPKLSVDIVKN